MGFTCRALGVILVALLLVGLAVEVRECSPNGGLSERVDIPGGAATIGQTADPEWLSITRSYPRKTEVVAAFQLARFEVTNDQYQKFVESVREFGHQRWCHPDEPPLKSHDPGRVDSQGLALGSLPVTDIDWFDAFAYAASVGGRLPSDVEWEYAAGGRGGYQQVWGNDGFRESHPTSLNDYPANCRSDRKDLLITGPAQGGAFPIDRSDFGCMDMAGNVREWTATEAEFKNTPLMEDPGCSDRHWQVAKGGAFSSLSFWQYPIAHRSSYPRCSRKRDLGFRVAWSISR